MKLFTTLTCILFFLCSQETNTLYGQNQTLGVFQNDSSSFNGYTLVAPTASRNTYLIDNCGYIVNQWESDNTPGLSTYLLEDGSLLRTQRVVPNNFAAGGTGGRIEIRDWNDNQVWSYVYSDSIRHQHHDIEYLPNGNILVLAWEFHSLAEAYINGRDSGTLATGIWSEQIVELEPIGTDSANIVWQWRLWDHLIQDIDPNRPNYGDIRTNPQLVDINYRGMFGSTNIDWTHANGVDYNEEFDQIMISVRNFNEVWIIDHSTTTAEAATSSGGTYGKGGDLLYRWGNPTAYKDSINPQFYYEQHDVHWIQGDRPSAGKIIAFNNGLARPDGNYSSVDIFTPDVDAQGNYNVNNNTFLPHSLDWQYADPGTFFSTRLSGAEELPNGNILICEGQKGRVFEVQKDSTLVWNFINPVSNAGRLSQGTVPFGNALFRTYRYSPDYAAFDNITLTPTEPLELDPFPSNCVILTDSQQWEVYDEISLYPNPTDSRIVVERNTDVRAEVMVYNAVGELVLQTQIYDYLSLIDVFDFQQGMYIINIYNTETARTNTIKFIKI